MNDIWTSKKDWDQWDGESTSVSSAYTRLPIIRRYSLEPGQARVPSWKRAWERADEHAFVLESGKSGRYTYLGLRPEAILRGKGNEATISYREEKSGTRSPETLAGAPLEVMRSWMDRFRAPKVEGAPKFAGGCVGYWSYDVVRSIERLPELAEDDLGLPDYAFFLVDELWVIDHEESALYCAVHCPTAKVRELGLEEAYDSAARRIEEMKELWGRLFQLSSDEHAELERRRLALTGDLLQMDIEAYQGIRTATSKAAFMEAVRRIQDYISQGDVFQVNLSLRMSRPTRTEPEELYEWLRLFNPSPYMSFVRFPDFQLVSASPELLVKLDDNRMSARPIAGTRRRGRTAEEDERFAEELLTSEKERAEHIMLVDLERNDLGRVADYGTVHVPELLTIERYSHVMHLVSQVEGTLAPGKDAFDLIAAAFPGGTITGAPKIRTMEIIEELEPVRRGPYTGSLGWIDYAGNMEFNIIIRTIAVKDGHCHIQAGAGIVIDSDPEREFYECLNKAKALWKAVQYGERQQGEA